MWVITILEYLTGFVPRPVIVRPDEGGFRQVPKPWGGSWVKEMKPGTWFWVIPWFTEHNLCRVKTQTKDVRAQSVWTKDGKNLTVSASVQYYIVDPLKALLEVYDYDQSLQNIVLTVVCEFIQSRTLEEVRQQMDQFREELTRTTRKNTEGWGLKIQRVSITDIGDASNLRLLVSGLEHIVTSGGSA